MAALPEHDAEALARTDATLHAMIANARDMDAIDAHNLKDPDSRLNAELAEIRRRYEAGELKDWELRPDVIERARHRGRSD